MSLLLSELAFAATPLLRDEATLGVLGGSLISLILAGDPRRRSAPGTTAVAPALGGGARRRRRHADDRSDRMSSDAGRAHGAIRCAQAADTMRDVRDRCVWTQQIDHRALVPYLVEESAELIDAVEAGSRAELREELGDLLWQVLFHAEIASRDADDPFDIDDVARGLTEKMVRRHPHVFAGEVAETPEQVLVLWNAAKAAEKHERTSVLDGVSERMPSPRARAEAASARLRRSGRRCRRTQRRSGRAAARRPSSATRCSRWSRPRARTGGMPSARSASGFARSQAEIRTPSGVTARAATVDTDLEE